MDNPYQQARCPECGHNLAEWTKPHPNNCAAFAQMLEAMRPAKLSQEQQASFNAGLQNAYGYGDQDPNTGHAPDLPPSVRATLSGQPKR